MSYDDNPSVATRFGAGNQWWTARAKHGRDKQFLTADDLWTRCCEYFQWVEENPLWETKSYMYQGVPVQDQLPKMRAMTIAGLCLFIDLSMETWRKYRSDPDFVGVVTKVEQIIYNQKFVGASADLLNANIIARDLGLADKREVSGKDGGPVQVVSSEMTPEEASRLYKEMLNPTLG